MFSLFAAIMVTGLQIAIAILGQGRLDEYEDCLEQSLSEQLMINVTIPSNSSIPVRTLMQ